MQVFSSKHIAYQEGGSVAWVGLKREPRDAIAHTMPPETMAIQVRDPMVPQPPSENARFAKTGSGQTSKFKIRNGVCFAQLNTNLRQYRQYMADEDERRARTGAKNAFLESFTCKTDDFTKTGSGQT